MLPMCDNLSRWLRDAFWRNDRSSRIEPDPFELEHSPVVMERCRDNHSKTLVVWREEAAIRRSGAIQKQELEQFQLRIENNVANSEPITQRSQRGRLDRAALFIKELIRNVWPLELGYEFLRLLKIDIQHG